MKNILAQAEPMADERERVARDPMSGISAVAGTVRDMHPAQRELFVAASEIGERVDRLRVKREYVRALEEIAMLRGPVDYFFEQVMVMDPDENVRNSRVVLLMTVLRKFSGIADFSEIVTAG